MNMALVSYKNTGGAGAYFLSSLFPLAILKPMPNRITKMIISFIFLVTKKYINVVITDPIHKIPNTIINDYLPLRLLLNKKINYFLSFLTIPFIISMPTKYIARKINPSRILPVATMNMTEPIITQTHKVFIISHSLIRSLFLYKKHVIFIQNMMADSATYHGLALTGSAYRIAIPRNVYIISVYIPKTEKVWTSVDTLTTSSARYLPLACAYRAEYPVPPLQNNPKIIFCFSVCVTGPKISYRPSAGKDLSLESGFEKDAQLEINSATSNIITTFFNFIWYVSLQENIRKTDIKNHTKRKNYANY